MLNKFISQFACEICNLLSCYFTFNIPNMCPYASKILHVKTKQYLTIKYKVECSIRVPCLPCGAWKPQDVDESNALATE